MLPETLASTYQRYKHDTDFVATWLASTAKVCGYPADLLSSKSWDPPQTKPKSARVKGKARKTAPKSTTTTASTAAPKYVVSLSDFLPLANFIAKFSKPPVRVPDVLATTINRVIDVRSGFGGRMEEHGIDVDPIEDKNHNFFVGVLEAVRDALRPRMSSKAAEAAAPAQTTQEDRTFNRFASLSVYEPSQEFLDSPVIQSVQSETKDNVVYEAEQQTSPEELFFAFVLLMTDLNKIRKHIKWIWSNHRDGMFDLAAAAVATDTAVEFGHGLIDELDPLFKTLEGGTEVLTRQFYTFLCLHNGMEPDRIARDFTSGFQVLDSNTYRIADEACILVYTLLNALPAVINPKGIPLYKEGTFGVYNPDSNRETKTGEQMFQEDKILITEVFTELMTVIRLVPQYPVKDEFLRAIIEIDKTLQVPFWGVFAAQVFLDIHHTLRGSITRSFEIMVNQSSIMANNLGQHLEFHKNLKSDSWPASNDLLIRQRQKFIQWLGRDPVFIAKSRMYAQHPGLDADPISQHRLLLYCPVISGLTLFRLRAEVLELSIAVANGWGSIAYPAHLYNALQKEKLLSPGNRWVDMDHALHHLGDSSIWVGEGENHRPSNPAEYLTRFSLQMGVTASAFADPRKVRKSKKFNLHSRAGPRGIKYGTAAVSYMFADRYCKPDSGQVEWTPEHVQNILEHSAYEIKGSLDDPTLVIESIDDPVKLREKRANAAKILKGKGRARGGGKVEPTDLIKALVMSLSIEALEVSFPYLLLHRMAWRLLRELKVELHPLICKIYSPDYMDQEIQLPWIIGGIFMAASTGDMRLLQAAGLVFDRFIETGAGSVCMVIVKEMGFDVVETEDEDETDESSSEAEAGGNGSTLTT